MERSSSRKQSLCRESLEEGTLSVMNNLTRYALKFSMLIAASRGVVIRGLAHLQQAPPQDVGMSHCVCRCGFNIICSNAKCTQCPSSKQISAITFRIAFHWRFANASMDNMVVDFIVEVGLLDCWDAAGLSDACFLLAASYLGIRNTLVMSATRLFSDMIMVKEEVLKVAVTLRPHRPEH